MKNIFTFFKNKLSQNPLFEVDKPSDNTSVPKFIFEEKIPEFPGGSAALFAFLVKNIIYPKDAFDSRIFGKVIVRFTVDKDGSIVNTHVKKSQFFQRIEMKNGKTLIKVDKCSTIESEAIRVIQKMPRWTPGYQQGKAVKVTYTLPIKFKVD